MTENAIFEKLVSYIVGNDIEKFSDFFDRSSLTVNARGKSGWSFLHYAAQYNAVEIGQKLIDRGADVNAKDTFGNNVLWRATFASQGKGDFIKLLLSNGANKSAKNNFGVSPVDLADTIDNYDIKQFFNEEKTN